MNSTAESATEKLYQMECAFEDCPWVTNTIEEFSRGVSVRDPLALVLGRLTGTRHLLFGTPAL